MTAQESFKKDSEERERALLSKIATTETHDYPVYTGVYQKHTRMTKALFLISGITYLTLTIYFKK